MNSRLLKSVITAVAISFSTVGFGGEKNDAAQHYDVVIAGGSTAALAAAFAAAEEGASVVLLEPTDWIGGQLTSSAVPAVDEAWHKIHADGSGHGSSDPGDVLLNVAAVARDPRNMTPFFRDALLATGNPGRGWVSRFCFEPRPFMERFLLPRERELADRLTVLRDTVVKRVETKGNRITAIVAIERTPRAGVAHGGYDQLPSADLADWYAAEDSERFTKTVHRFTGALFIDATEWGEVLALTDAPMLQGVETVDGEIDGDDTCGQSTTFDFVQRFLAEPTTDHPAPPLENGKPVGNLGYGAYRDKADAWARIWTYRRIKGSAAAPSIGDLCLQNWGYDIRSAEGGNDYPFGYLFLSRALTSAQRDDWRGGIDLLVMAAAERRALAWHEWFRHAAPQGIDPDQIQLDGSVLGTGHGIAKLPYIRDTRRSIGVGGFLLKFEDLIAPIEEGKLPRRTGTEFPDRIALGAYPADIHPLVGCEYPDHVHVNHPTMPFYIPLRALTNEGYTNLMVAGKTMAQTFVANSATRLHPIEWSSGTAAGVIAADLAASGSTTAAACDDYERLRKKVAKHTPVDWVID
ncbi:FAD-dependent oxidoreductase [Botrimarina hoheduenensis]|uniref:Tricarballylate dehydrogenase n=1 Tax=Botrimarina hoheduenensis TaxID=2528000 RepID=A0A5C5WCA0_9BACT|nr:FAD-dependent oxidoreductase [Botrimarina hoheduenensis]TWT48294.1 tricarballylate dehydrogenase [Botrimarina hoheduenensis]